MSAAATHHTILALLTATSLVSAYVTAAGWNDSGQGITVVHFVPRLGSGVLRVTVNLTPRRARSVASPSAAAQRWRSTWTRP